MKSSGAFFSPCRTWRYGLWRIWRNADNPNVVAFVGLNPSTADELIDDPTIRRCIGFAKLWGFDGMYMLNAYAFRATDPRVMKRASDPLGEQNLAMLEHYCKTASRIIAAWGTHCPREHEEKVCEAIGRTIHCLGRSKSGRPKHPLYLRADTVPELFWEPAGRVAE